MKRLVLGGLGVGLLSILGACVQTPSPPVNPAECPVGPLSTQGVEEPLKLQGLGRFEGEYVPGELLVLPGPGFSAETLRVQGAEPLRELSGGLLKIKVPPGQEKAKAEALLKAGVRYAQPNYVYRPLRVPNDPYYLSYQRLYLDGLVRLQTAWDFSTGRGCPPLVAVLDTGVLPHEDFQASRYLPQGVQLDVADKDTDPTDDSEPSSRGHGLGVASVLGADTLNSRGIAGTTWGGYIVPIKVFYRGGGATSETLREGVKRARELGARVVNISLGGNFYDGILENELAQARSQGVVLVAAAGNYPSPYQGYPSGGPVMFPASSPSVLAVGAVDLARQRASFSAYGPELDLVAPGVDVYAARPQGGYGFYSGTSFASPIVAGVVALYMSRYASERRVWPTPDRVYTCLTGTAEDLGAPGRDDKYGFGLVRADRVMTDTTYCFP